MINYIHDLTHVDKLCLLKAATLNVFNFAPPAKLLSSNEKDGSDNNCIKS